MQFYRRDSRPVEPSAGLRCDQTILLTGIRTSERYPAALRRIRHFGAEKDMRLTFLTNNFLLPALTIARLYRARWQVELFFRWIKQHLGIKAFYGTSESAVKTQTWVAVSVYVLVAIVKKQLGPDLSLYQILQILSLWRCFPRSSARRDIGVPDRVPGPPAVGEITNATSAIPCKSNVPAACPSPCVCAVFKPL